MRKTFIGQYIYNLALSIDQFINTIILGDPDDSISGRCGRAMRGEPKWWVKPLRDFIDWLFLVLFNEVGHCANAIEPEEKLQKELWKWSK